jgi:hypothetical protein
MFGRPPRNSPAARAQDRQLLAWGSPRTQGINHAKQVEYCQSKWNTATSPSQIRRSFSPSTTPVKEDIEGSRPALLKFQKRCNQRIMPDPYPGAPCAPRTIDHYKNRKSPLYFSALDLEEEKFPHFQQQARQHPYWDRRPTIMQRSTEGTDVGVVEPATGGATRRPSSNGEAVAAPSTQKGAATPPVAGNIVVKTIQVYSNGKYREIPKTIPANSRVYGAAFGVDLTNQHLRDGPKAHSENEGETKKSKPAPGKLAAPAGPVPALQPRLSFHNPSDIDGSTPRSAYERLVARKVRATTPPPLTQDGRRKELFRGPAAAKSSGSAGVSPTTTAAFVRKSSSLDTSDIPGASPRRLYGRASPRAATGAATSQHQAQPSTLPGWW